MKFWHMKTTQPKYSQGACVGVLTIDPVTKTVAGYQHHFSCKIGHNHVKYGLHVAEVLIAFRTYHTAP
jgi:chemotaxis receptor (MCP) glutamine deamidase CheD